MNLLNKESRKNLLKYFNPRKYIDFLRQYPRVQNLSKIDNKITKSILMKYYFSLVKKNKSLKNFFIDRSPYISRINFNVKDLHNGNDEIFNSLASNGIVVLEEALSPEERNKILNFFSEIETNKISSIWKNDKIIDASSVKFKDAISTKNEIKNTVKISYIQKDPEYLPDLLKLNDIITKRIFGKSVKTVAEFFLHNCSEKENYELYGDTKFHIDRYLPCVKIIYTPDEIDISKGPFGFIKKTHKLQNKFMNTLAMNSKSFAVDENELDEDLKSNIVNGTCPKNSLIITFTNGLHKRNVFQKKNKRRTIFFQFTNNFNFFSLLNHKNYN